jgi:hypothetical protein
MDTVTKIQRQVPADSGGLEYWHAIGFLQLGWPALAGTAAAALLSAFLGRIPEPGDREIQIWITMGLLILVGLILAFGGTIERMLECFAGVQIFWLNRRFLPPALRPPLWREVLLLGCAGFYAFFSFFVFKNLIQSL